MIVCKKCGEECDEGEMFCVRCGAALYGISDDKDDKSSRIDLSKETPEKDSYDDFISDEYDNGVSGDDPFKAAIGGDPYSFGGKPVKEKDGKKEAQKSAKGSKSGTSVKNVSRRDERRKKAERLRKGLKIAGVIIFIIVVAAAVLSVVSAIKAKEGERLAMKVPVGRNIEYCMKETGEEFSNTASEFKLKSVAVYDYVKYADTSVKIDGTEMPSWAVMLSVDREKAVKSVEYYNFAVLKKGWKGTNSKLMYTIDSITYGMDRKAVRNVLSFEPYYIKRSSSDRTTYCYRYYINDSDTGSERVFNYYVVYNDNNDTVVNAYFEEIDYLNYVLGVEPED